MSYLEELHNAHKERQLRFNFRKRRYSLDPNRIKINIIVKQVAEEFNSSFKQIKGSSKNIYVVKARQVVFYIAYELFGMSSSTIARYCGHKCHTTVLYGKDVIKERLTTSKILYRQITNIRKRLGK